MNWERIERNWSEYKLNAKTPQPPGAHKRLDGNDQDARG